MQNDGYVKAVNALIPQAVQYADNHIKASGIREKNMKGADGKPYSFCLWTEQFHIAMAELTAQAGLR